MKEKKHRVEDALQATRAALEEGIVPGGGVALLNAADKVRESLLERARGRREDGRARSCCARSRSRCASSRPTRASKARSSIQSVRSAKPGQGLNVDTGEVEDLVKAGIIDPTMVTRSALQNAASIGKNILTTEAIVADAPEKAGAACRRRHAGHVGDDVGGATGSRDAAEARAATRAFAVSRSAAEALPGSGAGQVPARQGEEPDPRTAEEPANMWPALLVIRTGWVASSGVIGSLRGFAQSLDRGIFQRRRKAQNA